MVLKLYGSAMAFSRVLVTILEKGLPYEHVMVDIAKGDQKTDAYKSLQPFGKVPALEDDGFVIFESRAICKYLERFVGSLRAFKAEPLIDRNRNNNAGWVRKYATGPKLIPDDDDTLYGLFEQACSVEQSYFAAAAETIGTELIIKKRVFPLSAIIGKDQRRVAQAEADLDEVLAYYDKTLANQKYLIGDEITLVDLFHLPNAAALKALGWESAFEKYPRVDQWLTRLRQRDTWLRAAEAAATPV